ncbi:hypothetical protein DPMN_182652 [Dreissena polymorpha]|uniref:Uncharacterized protein n=1 Tax=Dreissena polymorpha TaxID=45954 RepID=A0A9D4DF74_DREPO|nr:hypothetical protein DPMN_182652 [Dreissena polymorpha]
MGLSFTVSSGGKLSAVDLFLPIIEGCLTGVVEILEESTIKHTQNVTLNYKKDKEPELIHLETCVHLSAGKVYSIRQRLKGSSAFTCYGCAEKITVKDVTMSLTNLQVGLIEDLTSVSTGQFYGFELLIKTTK